MSDSWSRVSKPTNNSWNKINKPSTNSWSNVPKPSNLQTSNVVLHAKGKFMGVLGLTYPGATVTVTTNVDWSKINKPTS